MTLTGNLALVSFIISTNIAATFLFLLFAWLVTHMPRIVDEII